MEKNGYPITYCIAVFIVKILHKVGQGIKLKRFLDIHCINTSLAHMRLMT